MGLPWFFQLPRRFGVGFGCVVEVGGSRWLVARFSKRGVAGRYKISLDSVEDIERRARRRVERGGGIPQLFVDSLLELAERYSVELVRECVQTRRVGVYAVELGRCREYALIDGVRTDPFICGGAEDVSRCVARIQRHVETELRRRRREEEKRSVYEFLYKALRNKCPSYISALGGIKELEELIRDEAGLSRLSKWCEFEEVLRRVFPPGPVWLVKGWVSWLEPPAWWRVLLGSGVICVQIEVGWAYCYANDKIEKLQVVEEGGEILAFKDRWELWWGTAKRLRPAAQIHSAEISVNKDI
jgi:hypothetical protein